MKIRTVAQIGEDVLRLGERRLSEPRRAFAAHVCEGRSVAVHPHRHEMTADAGDRAAAFRHFRRGVVRTAGAEVGRPRNLHFGPTECRFLRCDECEPLGDAIGGVKAFDSPGDRARDHRRRQFARRGQQPGRVRIGDLRGSLAPGRVRIGDLRGSLAPVPSRQCPLALLVELADDARTHVFPRVIELFLQLIFDDRSLFLDDQNFFEPRGEATDRLGLERPRHRDLEQPNADLRGVTFVDAQIVERLPHIHIRLAAGDDAETRLRRIEDDLVELVDARVMQRRVDLVIEHTRLGGEKRVGPADVESVRRHRKIGRDNDLHPLGIDRHRR